ncbi:MAG: M48 family metallopeptidase [Saprospiraceae bacterium]|nr:M48 family metallopeptidase [Saprospiraceae bacterium]
MKSDFIGLYYDGNKGSKSEVKVLISKDEVVISNDTIGVIVWPFNKISAHRDNDDKRCFLSYHFGKKSTHLEIVGQEFWKELIAASPEEFNQKKKSPYEGIKKLAVLIFLILLGFGIFYFYALPKIVDRLAINIPYQWEQELGDKLFQQLTKSEKIDSFGSLQLDEFFHDFKKDSFFPAKIFLVNSNLVNAFAMPGGNIVVYSGIIEKMESYPELVSLLFHEYGHVVKRHVFRGMIQSVTTFAFVSLILGDVTALSSVLLEQANSIYNLKFSRAYETESDRFAFQTMKELSIDPQGLIDLFQRLKDIDSSKDSTKVSSIPSFLSTHPGTEERIENVHEWIRKEAYPYRRDSSLEEKFIGIQSHLTH